MARATRSSATTTTSSPEKDKPADSPPTSRKGASKKRKRNSNAADNGDSPPTKHARTESKDESSPQPELHPESEESKDLPSSGDVPLQSEDAANILQVLELVDNQGLLDRVFPLPTTEPAEAAQSESSSPTTMLSFRSLLQNSSQYPLRVLRAAVKHLYPISYHPRSRPSEPAAQQLRFCDLAISLLDQASQHNAPVPLSAESIIPNGETPDVDDAPTTPQASPSGVHPRKYALVQHLPTGDWWTSVSSTSPATDAEEVDLKSLPTAKAELVAVFPTPSRLDSELDSNKHTLGDYVRKKPPGTAHYKPAPPRRVSCGKFLYYGPYASFAPCFDQDGVEVGRVAMGEVIFQQEMRRRIRALAKGKRKAFIAATEDHAQQTEDVEMQVDGSDDRAAGPSSEKKADVAKGIEALLPSEEVEAIKSALGTLEMEQAVDELLQRNAKALQLLEELQLARLREQGSGSSIVEVGSEEWDVAQGIIESLALLASLRPRRSNGDADESPLVPSPSVLHKLQRTLPIGTTEGWYGTLPEGRTTAFRDDTTVHIRSAASRAAAATATTAAATATAISTTPAGKTAPVAAGATPAAAIPPYTPYSYSGSYQNSQYRGGYGTYTPGTQGGGSYYSSYPATQGSTTTQGHYPNTSYGGQSGYSYSPWYGYGNQTGAGASGRATPQPATATSAYQSYYASGTAAPQQTPTPQQRAVANTVVSTTAAKPAYQPATWGSGTAGGYVAPTLPPHMRSAGATPAGTPPPPAPAAGTATAGTGGYPAAGYYGGYQAPR
ncbi:hypothetical protein FKP32DRAFT_1596208 [Trametes sanguinea]|nr:hypothetical protein FKP32DRAFT_1596208 [Trametes sanguinea]